ncbi:MAG: peptidoglycan DD-metalloendopeptidase family protein [Candidatus Nitrohelix vancouverensis]|uniref:Peptidoglycan DD-metalloendopeptidase family protein n=1 Tax=Candidatus Nitrohelix vancouverensis TaxID=2705534 RepID=A0A7T0C3S0_9BACT|nr:MAG: peptidoglycan DD-metalloendopeptidase family protein [Candidatus Nitrohelix vancouverensis]
MINSRFLIALTCLLVSLVANSVFSQDIDEISDLLEGEKKELEILKKRMEKQKRSISSVGAQTKSALSTLRNLDDQLKLSERELKIYQWNMKANERKIEALGSKTARNEKEMVDIKDKLSRRIRSIYKEGNLFPLKLMFSAENFNDLISQSRYIQSITEYDADLLRSHQQQIQEFQAERDSLERARTQLVRFEKNARKKQEEIKGQKQEKSAFLKKLKREKKLYLQAHAELKNSAGKLNSLIAGLEEKLIRGEGLDISDKKGRLQLPVDGKILNRFGEQKHKDFGAIIVYNGVNIEASKGDAVRAVSSGTTLFADFLEGYGNLVILGHGKEYHSLYGHLDDIITEVGKTVRTGQIIGRSGDTGSIEGETLYFEIRHNGKPVEPTQWFAVAKK